VRACHRRSRFFIRPRMSTLTREYRLSSARVYRYRRDLDAVHPPRQGSIVYCLEYLLSLSGLACDPCTCMGMPSPPTGCPEGHVRPSAGVASTQPNGDPAVNHSRPGHPWG
jgi:hypothetical protein